MCVRVCVSQERERFVIAGRNVVVLNNQKNGILAFFSCAWICECLCEEAHAQVCLRKEIESVVLTEVWCVCAHVTHSCPYICEAGNKEIMCARVTHSCPYICEAGNKEIMMSLYVNVSVCVVWNNK